MKKRNVAGMTARRARRRSKPEAYNLNSAAAALVPRAPRRHVDRAGNRHIMAKEGRLQPCDASGMAEMQSRHHPMAMTAEMNMCGQRRRHPAAAAREMAHGI